MNPIAAPLIQNDGGMILTDAQLEIVLGSHPAVINLRVQGAGFEPANH